MHSKARSFVNQRTVFFCTKMTYELLLIRLDDKADHLPKSNIMSEEVVKYFSKYGNAKEKQEAYYYNGSVYRNLQDTPRAMENFLKSIEIGENSHHCDSLLLRNAYSNMHFLFYNVQDYKNSLRYVLKEYQLSKEIRHLELLQLLHVAIGYFFTDDMDESKHWFDKAYEYSQKETSINEIDAFSLIYYLSHLNETTKAKSFLKYIHHKGINSLDGSDLNSVAEYYLRTNNTDSAIYCYERTLAINSKRINRYDAAKLLFLIYNKRGDGKKALKYAKIYVDVSDSLDLGKRQEMAATVNNQFQYHLDKTKQ